MSRAPPEDINEAGIAPPTGTLALSSDSSPFSPTTVTPIGDQCPPRLAQTQAPQRVSDFVDGSGPIFSTYLELATEIDKKMAKGWIADADGILVFVRLNPLLPYLTKLIHGYRPVYSLLLSHR